MIPEKIIVVYDKISDNKPRLAIYRLCTEELTHDGKPYMFGLKGIVEFECGTTFEEIVTISCLRFPAIPVYAPHPLYERIVSCILVSYLDDILFKKIC